MHVGLQRILSTLDKRMFLFHEVYFHDMLKFLSHSIVELSNFTLTGFNCLLHWVSSVSMGRTAFYSTQCGRRLRTARRRNWSIGSKKVRMSWAVRQSVLKKTQLGMYRISRPRNRTIQFKVQTNTIQKNLTWLPCLFDQWIFRRWKVLYQLLGRGEMGRMIVREKKEADKSLKPRWGTRLQCNGPLWGTLSSTASLHRFVD